MEKSIKARWLHHTLKGKGFMQTGIVRDQDPENSIQTGIRIDTSILIFIRKKGSFLHHMSGNPPGRTGKEDVRSGNPFPAPGATEDGYQ
jgi:hypothetical protein